MSKIHCFKHVFFEDIGCIKDWCVKNGHELSYTKFYEDGVCLIPKPIDYDWLVVMGGPMGVYEDEKYVWFKEEKKAVKQAIENNKTVIGICLGAQLIAEALGAKVYKNKEKEIGWLPITVVEKNKADSPFESFKDEFTVFHFHGDTFEIPKGAKPLASSAACANQAFLYDDKVLALQFHLEVTKESVKDMVLNCAGDFCSGKYIQTLDEILNNDKYIEQNNRCMFDILDYLNKAGYEKINCKR
ncbi:MAG: type 1 glutamine amidotransferase [Endomicrobium sp.]|jgi:GMP synthase (glutamine-hydrolysing)|nr:type 1 glutamine amidotransferase [Endomicrobium sp.]